MSALDNETRQQAEAVATGCFMMALRLAEKIDRGTLQSPVSYTPDKRLTIAEIRAAGIKRLESLLELAREQKPMGNANNGSHKRRGSGALTSLIMELAQWSGFKPSLHISWKTIGLTPTELRDLAEHYALERRSGVREVLQALPAA